jgi:hypothetical protein
MTRSRIASASLGVMMLAITGCAGQGWLFQHPRGWEQIVTECPLIISADECQRLKPVRMTSDANGGREAWQYEARVKVVAPMPGVPGATMNYGRMPLDITIVGSRDDCERVRQLEPTDLPTEACKGPLYFTLDQ